MVDEDKIARGIKRESRDVIISCAAALKLAKELGVPGAEVGKIANRLGVKIRSCQLGCF